MAVIAYALLLFMLINTSSMLEFHVIVAAVVMFNIMELIVKILPNYPTQISSNTGVDLCQLSSEGFQSWVKLAVCLM